MIFLDGPSLHYPFYFFQLLVLIHQINTSKTSYNSTVLYCWISLPFVFQWQHMPSIYFSPKFL